MKIIFNRNTFWFNADRIKTSHTLFPCLSIYRWQHPRLWNVNQSRIWDILEGAPEILPSCTPDVQCSRGLQIALFHLHLYKEKKTWTKYVHVKILKKNRLSCACSISCPYVWGSTLLVIIFRTLWKFCEWITGPTKWLKF